MTQPQLPPPDREQRLRLRTRPTRGANHPHRSGPSRRSGASAAAICSAIDAIPRRSAPSSACPIGSSGVSSCRGDWACCSPFGSASATWPTTTSAATATRTNRMSDLLLADAAIPQGFAAYTLVAFGAYMAGVFLLGFLAHFLLKRGAFLKEYFLGDRKLGPWVLALTYVATSVSAGSFVGFPSVHLHERLGDGALDRRLHGERADGERSAGEASQSGVAADRCHHRAGRAARPLS